MSAPSYYVTTPIYYVNAEPHLGHAYSTMAADILARHMRQRGEDVFFLTGTDEHGEPIETGGRGRGSRRRSWPTATRPSSRRWCRSSTSTNDFFIRTSDPRHEAKVAEIMQRVYDNGWVDKGVYEGWYCPRCADFKTERELGPGNTCPIHEIPLEREREENWFFQLSAFQAQLEALYEERPDFVVPDFRRNEAVSFIKQGLEDVSLSRPKLKWGLPLPWDPDQRMYVWFDALLNYVTALTFAREGEDLTERFWPADLHVMAKDILKFHAVIWPALLPGRRPRAAAADGDPRLPADGREKDVEVARQRARPVRGDRPLRRRRAALLLLPRGQLRPGRLDLDRGLRGPLRDRARQRLRQPRQPGAGDGRPLPRRHRPGGGRSTRPWPRTSKAPSPASRDLLDRAELTQALEVAWMLVRRLNRYVEETQPWVLAKDEADPERLDEVLYNLVEGLRVTTLLLVPYLPQTSETLLAALGEDGSRLAELGSRPGGQRVERMPPLFPKIETTPALAARRRQVGGADLARPGQAAERHRQVELGEDHLQHRFDAGLAVERQAPDVGAAEADGVGAEGERLEHVGAAADAAVEEDRELAADRLGDRRQGVERARSRRRPGGRRGWRRRSRRRRGATASRASSTCWIPLTRIGSEVCSRSQARSSQVSAGFAWTPRKWPVGGALVLLRRLLQARRGRPGPGSSWRRRSPFEERQPGLLQVARLPAGDEGVDGERRSPRSRPRSARSTKLSTRRAVVGPVELEPARRLAAGLGDLLEA